MICCICYRRLLKVVENINCEKRSSSAGQSKMLTWQAVIPPAKLCTDNGVMVAWAGIELFCRGISSAIDKCHENYMEPIPRWSLGPHVNRNNDIEFRKRVKIKLN